MHVVDATCPLVSKVHREVLRFVKEGYEIIYIGHKGHDEAVGVVGESPEHVHLIEHESDVDSLDFSSDTKLVLLSQTTLSVDETAGTIAALKERFPWLEMPPNSDICYATSNRQAAVKLVAEQSDCVVIVGSANSSNSVRLMEVAQEGLNTRFGGVLDGACGKAHRVMMRPSLIPHGSMVLNPWESRRAHPYLTNWCQVLLNRCKAKVSMMWPPLKPLRKTCISCFPVNFVRNRSADWTLRASSTLPSADRRGYAVKHLEQIVGIDAD